VDGPNRDVRDAVISLLDETAPPEDRTQADESRAEAALQRIEEVLRADVSGDERLGPVMEEVLAGHSVDLPDIDGVEANELLAVVQEWAGLASYVSARVYGPGSPMPRKLAGWSRKAVATLQRIANLLLVGLRTAGKALGAATVSIAVSFPWGISIGLNW